VCSSTCQKIPYKRQWLADQIGPSAGERFPQMRDALRSAAQSGFLSSPSVPGDLSCSLLDGAKIATASTQMEHVVCALNFRTRSGYWHNLRK
jgi:hypothetical protein